MIHRMLHTLSTSCIDSEAMEVRVLPPTVGVGSDKIVQSMQVQDGYPTNYVTQYYQALCVPWNPVTRLPKQNTSDIYPTPGQTTSLGGSNFQFNFNYNNFGISVGDYITVRGLHCGICSCRTCFFAGILALYRDCR